MFSSCPIEHLRMVHRLGASVPGRHFLFYNEMAVENWSLPANIWIFLQLPIIHQACPWDDERVVACGVVILCDRHAFDLLLLVK